MARFAILMQGSTREAVFLCGLFPHVVGNQSYDLYLCIRQTDADALSRMSRPEKPFRYEDFLPVLGKNVFLCVLPPYDKEVVRNVTNLPVGPTSIDTEIQVLGMFLGIFAGVKQVKNSGRRYDYVVRTRTDYLFWDAPLFDKSVEMYEANGGKILIDSQRTSAYRYQDKPHLPWQGSISDLFSFSSYEQFLRLWDFEEDLARLWTGVPETVLFRNALSSMGGEQVQHPRKNESFLRQHFYVLPGGFRESDHYFRHDVLSDEIKSSLLATIEASQMPARQNLSLVWTTYRRFQQPQPSGVEAIAAILDGYSKPEKESFLEQVATHLSRP